MPEYPVSKPEKSPEQAYWLDQPDNIRLLVRILVVVTLISLVAELFILKSTHFNFEGWLGFHGWFGFLSYCGLIFAARGLRKLIMRDTDYYARQRNSDQRPSDERGSDHG